MTDVKSRLTKEEKQLLQRFLGSRHLSLLYKGSIHTYHSNAFHSICNRQGPTVVVAYNASGYIFGAFTTQSYTSSGNHMNDSEAFLFRLKGKEEESSPLKFPVKVSTQAVSDLSGYGPYFGAGSLVFLSQNSAAVATNANTGIYTFRPEDLHGNDLVLLECEVYRVEDVGLFMETPWRLVEWTAGERLKLMDEIRTYKPYLNSVPQFRVLFLGPVGAGKSSFFNSVNSTFRGHVTNQAIAGSDSTSVTMQYRTYGIRDQSTGKPLPIIFCDTMGLEEKQGAGLNVDEVSNLLKGHVPDRYQMKLIEGKLGIPLNQIVPVKNYSSELELKKDVDILILLAVRQILRSSETCLENFYWDKSNVDYVEK